MKMTNLAMAVATTFLASTSAFAAQVYSGDGTSLAIGGYVDVGVGERDGAIYSDADFQVHQISPRLNVEGKKEIGNGVTVDAKGEWAIKYLDAGDTSFTTRLGYIGVTHEQAGRLVVGTQWAPYYDVVKVTDQPIAFASDFIYENHNQLGSARAEKMVSYRNKFEINNELSFGIGLGWQGEAAGSSLKVRNDNIAKTSSGDFDLDDRVQVAVTADFMGFGLGYVYSGGDISDAGGSEDAKSQMVSLKYGTYGKGLYAAIVYGQNDYFYDVMEETEQFEGLIAFGLDNGINISVNYETVEDDKNNKTVFSQSAVQVEYTITSGLVAFAGYQFDLGNDLYDDVANTIPAADEDQYTVGARYFF
ncbi:porin [Vibrio rhodolitus]|uniref:porin n=1 Tax=Vibrio rhodolitus TaxID=2231649 RepID=UPI000E0B9B90|nr:porin [Vibrio rhodolitus]